MPATAPSVLLWLALAPFVAAFVAPQVVRLLGGRSGWLLALVPAAIFLGLASQVATVSAGTVLTAGVAWVPELGVRYQIRLDGLSMAFGLLITGIGTFIVIYAGGYLAGHHHQGRFMAFLLLFMGAMLGLVLADDLVSLFVFYELTSITSFLLIGFDHTREAARRAAVQALIITGGGGLALLAGLVLMRIATGESTISGLLANPDALRDGPFYVAIFVLVALGAFTKSAQVPFHSWLPNAMEAPTPVSAYLHSATMVKAGVFVLMRFHPVLGETALWEATLTAFGAATFLAGVLLGIRQTDLKQILAYTTVASLGLLVLLVGVGTEIAIAGAVLYLLAHALFKGGLFMVAGAIDHETGTRDVTVLGGLAKKMPVTLIAALLGCLSMAGLPPLIGFVAKEVLYEGLWSAGGISFATLAALVGNIVMFAIAAVLLRPFVAKPGPLPKSPHEAPVSLWLGPLVLGALALVAALGLDATNVLVAKPMVDAIINSSSAYEPHLIPTGLKPAVILTLITVALGILVTIVYPRVRDGIAAALIAIGWGPDRGFDQVMRALIVGASRSMRIVQPGRMTTYVAIAFAALALALLLPAIGAGTDLGLTFAEAPAFHFVILAVAVTGVFVVVVAKNRLVAIVLLGVQGLMVALIFMLYGAPDLSFTQFMVETLSVVILALVMTRLDLKASDHRTMGYVARDATIAVACGAGFTVLLFGVTTGPFDLKLTEFFLEHAFEVAHGRNVVNVILVDYRALDTLGEIGVVMGAGLAILVLLRSGVKRTRAKDQSVSERTAAGTMVAAPQPAHEA